MPELASVHIKSVKVNTHTDMILQVRILFPSLSMNPSNPTVNIKVPFGLYKSANESKLLPLVKFYYRLKELTIHGSFKKEKFAQFCKDNTGISLNSCKKHIKNLLQNNFAIIQNNQICLVSYDKLWALLNIQKEKNKSYKIIKTTSTTFITDIYKEEIRNSLKKQEAETKKKFIKYELDAGQNAKPSLKKYFSKAFHKLKDVCLQKQQKIIQQTLSSKQVFNRQITLTCKSIAKLFGYNSPMKGHYIQNLLSDIGILRIEKQRHLKVSNATIQMFKSLNLDSSFYFHNNSIYKVLPNLISFY